MTNDSTDDNSSYSTIKRIYPVTFFMEVRQDTYRKIGFLLYVSVTVCIRYKNNKTIKRQINNVKFNSSVTEKRTYLFSVLFGDLYILKDDIVEYKFI